MSTEYKILATRWYTNRNATMGIVAIETRGSEQGAFEWKAYLGVGRGFDQDADEQHVAAWGCGLQPEEAHGFFPHLDIEKYKKE